MRQLRGSALALYGTLMVVGACSSGENGAEAVTEVEQQIVFGADDRVEYGGVSDASLLSWANATAALVPDGSLNCSGASCALSSTPYTNGEVVPGTWLDLCPGERFAGQPRAAHCTAFLVGPDLVATAGHCVQSQEQCAATNVVFGFTADANGGNARTTVPASAVYGCVDLIAQTFSGGPRDDDWALFRVDRLVTGRSPLAVRRSGAVSSSAALVTIGHPLGLPLKVATNGAVRENELTLPKFGTNLDASPGNSGSPVIDRATGLVEGVLSSGPTPEWQTVVRNGAECATARVCDDVTGCGGGPFPEWADATRIAGVVAALEGRSCHDDVRNGQETDVDCGGPECVACELGQGCELDTDCPFRAVCEEGECVEGPECTVPADCLDPRAPRCIVASCVSNECNLDYSGCECTQNEQCDDGIACTRDLCFASTFACVHIPEDCPAACNEQTAIDLGTVGSTTTVANDGCVRVRDGYPSWWGNARTLRLQSAAPGAYPVPFTWTSACAGSGSGQFTGNWQTRLLGPTSDACATVIDLGGDGSGRIALRFYGN